MTGEKEIGELGRNYALSRMDKVLKTKFKISHVSFKNSFTISFILHYIDFSALYVHLLKHIDRNWFMRTKLLKSSQNLNIVTIKTFDYLKKILAYVLLIKQSNRVQLVILLLHDLIMTLSRKLK